MANYKVAGPFKVKLITVTNSWYRLSSEQRELWANTKKEIDGGLWSKRGCYIFTNSSSTPIYVGKTDNCFGQECFMKHKRELLNEYFKEIGLYSNCVYIYFIYFTGLDATDVSAETDKMETDLIRKARTVNLKLLNTKKVNPTYKIQNEKAFGKTFEKNKRKKIK